MAASVCTQDRWRRDGRDNWDRLNNSRDDREGRGGRGRGEKRNLLVKHDITRVNETAGKGVIASIPLGGSRVAKEETAESPIVEFGPGRMSILDKTHSQILEEG